MMMPFLIFMISCLMMCWSVPFMNSNYGNAIYFEYVSLTLSLNQ